MNSGESSAQPGISVIVITLNEERNIRTCLDSLTRQDYPKDRYEIIVVDASTDKTAEIAAGYRGVRVVRSEKGFSRQKNAGWHTARFDIVAFTDADCIVPAGWLGAIATAMEDPECHAVGGDAFPPEGTGWLGRCIAAVGHPAGGSLGLDANVTPGPEGVAFVAGCNGAYTKDALVQVGGFDPRFQKGGEDVYLFRSLRKAGYRIHYAPDMFLYHKPHEPLATYWRWNIGVGVTRWNLNRPGPLRMICYPWFPLWPALLLLLWLVTLVVFWPLGVVLAVVGWLKWLAVLRLFSRPYQLLWKRRTQTGVSRFAAWFVVPFLVLLRQVGMSIGEWRQWKRVRSTGEDA